MQVYIYVWLCLFGACVGSFLNVVAARLPVKGAFLKEKRSRCPACARTLSALDMVPVFSWLFLRGKCRTCKVRISARYPLVEAVCAGLAALSFWQFGPDWATVAAFGALAVLLAIALIDWDTMEIPHSLIIALIPFAVVAVWIWPDVSLPARGIGLIAVSVPMLLLTLAVPGAFGGGDIRLIAVCGFLLGWQNLLLAFFISLLLGGGLAIILMATGKKGRKEHISFGPYICIGTAIALFWGTEIIEMYLRLLWR